MVSDYLLIFFSAFLPVTELRGSIPVGIALLHLNPWLTYIIAVMGNLIPMFLILWLMPVIERWFRKQSLLASIMDAIFIRTRRKFGSQYERFGAFALWLFVAIPLPITGVWTGTLAAWLFGIRPTVTYIFVTLGALTAGLIVTLLTLGIIAL